MRGPAASTGKRSPESTHRPRGRAVSDGAVIETVAVTVPYSVSRTDEEFTAFAAMAAPLLARTAWFLCGDEHRAEELVQQTLVKTYLAWPSARAGDPLAYARRTLANARIDTWRRLRRERLTAPEDIPDRGGSSGDAADRQADRDQLVRALALLSPRQRRVVVLRHLLGLTEREVAHELGVSIGTVKTTASRGLRRMRVVLEQPTGTHCGREDES